MLGRKLEDLTFEDIRALVPAGLSEGRTLEFKRDPLGGSDDAKREFLADLSSFANSQGGDLIFGVTDENGIATAADGVTVNDPDAEILRLESLARDGLQPRISGLHSRWLPKDSTSGAIVIRVPASLNAPHRIVFKNSGRFWRRHSRGKAEMDVAELREAFTASAGALQQLKLLHGQITKLSPIALIEGPCLFVTVVPLAQGRLSEDLSLTGPDDAAQPSWGRNRDWGPILEGYLVWSPMSDGTAYAQALTHRRGYVEMVSAQKSFHQEEPKWIWAAELQRSLRSNVSQGIRTLRGHGLEGPWVVMASLSETRGYDLHSGDHFTDHHPTTRSWFDLGNIVIEDDGPDAVTPIFDRIWWAFRRTRPAGWVAPP